MNTKMYPLLGVLMAVLILAGCSHNNGNGDGNAEGTENAPAAEEVVKIDEDNDGGIYKSVDGGKTFTQKVVINEEETLGDVDVLSFEIDRNNPDTLYLGTRENGLWRSTNGGDTWAADINNYTNVNAIAVDPSSSQTIYLAAMKNGRGKIFKTTNGAEKWDEIFTEKNDGPAVLSLAIDPANPQIIYAGDTLGGIYKSTDAGATWKTMLWARSSVKDIAIDSVNTRMVYFGTTGSGVLVSRDEGLTFANLIGDGNVFNIETHPAKEGVVFLSNKDGVQVSLNAGQTWNTINTLVKPENVDSRGLAIDPNNDSIVYYTSGRAFYKSTNRGETWVPVQLNVSRSIDIIKINSQDTNVIYLGLRKGGGSFFQLFPGL